jgi:hypothetical protein
MVGIHYEGNKLKLTATVYGQELDFEHNAPDVEIEFFDVKEYKIVDNFFIVIKNNGEQFATARHTVKKFSLTN